MIFSAAAITYRRLIAEVDGPDPNDNAYMAAAISGQVETLITWNEKDFNCANCQRGTVVEAAVVDDHQDATLTENGGAPTGG